MLSCEDFRAEIAALIDNEIGPEVRRHLEQHLAECKTCQVLYDSTRKTLTIITDAGAFDLPADLSDRLVDRIMAAVRKPGSN